MDATIIAGSLDGKELLNSIDKLVKEVSEKTDKMADGFVQGIDKMKLAMKDFAITQKVSVDVMQEAWRKMSTSFDAMVAAQSGATGGGNGSGKGKVYAPNTVGALEQEIALEKEKRREMQLGSFELDKQNILLEKRRTLLNEETSSPYKRIEKVFSREFGAANTMSTKTLQQAEDKLRRLISLQNQFKGTNSIDETKMNRLQKAIDGVTDKITKLRNAKPKSLKEVLGMDESSVDAITAKMRALKRVQLDPTNAAQVKQLGDEYQRLKRLQAELMGQNIQMTHSNNYLAQSFGYIRNRLVYAMTLGAATSFAKQVYEIRAQYELLERSLGVLVSSFQKGSEVFRELNDMALKSPFTLMELGTSAKQLTAYDFKANEVVDTTRRLADISAALGVPMERLTYNLGQIRAQTRLTARDARDFANAGLPVVKMLSDYYSQLEGQLVSTGDVYDRMTKKMVSYEDVLSVLFKATDEGGKFFDFQAKQAETLKVQLANLSLAWNNMLNDIGKSNQDLLSAPIHGLKSLFENWQVLSKTITDLVVVLGVAKVAQLAFNLSLSKGTIEQIKNIAANKASTSSDYQAVFAKNALTKAQAKYLLATNSKTRSLRKYIAESKLLTTQEYIQTRSAGKLKTAWYGASVAMQGAGNAMRSLVSSMVALAPQMAALAAISAIIDVIQAYNQQQQAIEEYGNTLRKNAEENAKSISELRKSLNFDDATKISEEEQLKAWDKIREQIELSSASAERFISILLTEDNMGERVNKAIKMLEALEEIHSIMTLWKDDDVVVTNDFAVLGIGADGLTSDLKDFVKAMKEGGEKTKDVINDTGVLESTWRYILDRVYDYSDYLAYIGAGTIHPMGWLKNIGDAIGLDFLDSQKAAISQTYQELGDEMDKFVNSLHNRLQKDEITNPFQIKEAMEQSLKDAAEANNWNQEELLNARILAEQKFREIYKRQLDSGNKDWNDALNGRTAAWEAWLKYLTAHHNAEFKSMATEQVSEENWAQDERRRMYEETFETFKKENALAAQEVEQTVNDLNTLQVHIRMFYDMPAPLSDVEQDFRARTGQLQNSSYFRNYANGAKSQLEVIDNLKKGQKELQAQIEATEKAGGTYAEENLADMKAENEALIGMIHSYNALTDAEEKANNRNGKKDVVGEALKQEIQLIKDMQSNYEKLRKAGVSNMDAIDLASKGYEATIIRINQVLSKFGIDKFNAANFAGKDVRSLLKSLEEQRQALLASGKVKTSSLQALDVEIQKLTVDAKTYDMKKVTDGLNSELGNLKDEYELAIELDANPELGGIFADMMGIDEEQLKTLPRTFNQVVSQLQASIDKLFADNNIDGSFDLTQMLDKGDFDKWVEERGNTLDDNFVMALNKIREYANKVRLDETKETTKSWSQLIDKYGQLQYKLVKIAKDATKEMKNIVNKFGNDEQKKLALDLANKISISQDPSEIARLQEQLRQLLNQVTQGNEQAVNINAAVQNQQNQQTSKAYWDDFKNSELYAMTFEDMANNSTRAIQLIMDKLEGLKDKVKEDPVSMKALIKSLEDAQKELNARDPFGGVARSLRDMSAASQETKTAQEALWRAEVDVEQAQQKVDDAEDGTPEEQAVAQQELANAVQRRTAAQVKLTQAENKGKKAQENLKSSLQGISNQLGNVQELFGVVSKLFRAGGDDETADAIDAISEGFSIMTTVIMGVVAAMTLLEASQPWLLAIAAALSVIVGLVSFLSGQDNKQIDAEIKDSELAVKRLELTYIDLEHAVNDAYGTYELGAKKVALANKELQLSELKKQLALEKSRDSKDRDEDRIIELRKQIKELEYDIKDASNEIANNLLGITSVGDASEKLVSSMIESFKQGEDYMLKFDETFENMIDNMILKAIVGKVIGDRIQEILDNIKKAKTESEQAKALSHDIESMKDMKEKAKGWTWYSSEEENISYHGVKSLDDYLQMLDRNIEEAEKKLNEVLSMSPSDIQQFLESASSMKGEVKDLFESYMESYGIVFGESSKKALSSLQQGIQGITESTAGALEAYMNGVSQQVYYQSDVLTQIRDTMQSFDLDVQLGTLSQMLLQLQQSYQVQQNIESILTGVLNPSGRAIVVELNS